MDENEKDEALLRAWRSGDRIAGDRLFDRHYRRVHRFFANKVGDPKELAQRTFLAFLESEHRYREGHSFRAYLLGIAYNVLRGHFRELRGAGSPLPLDAMSVRDMGQTPSEVIAIADKKWLVRAALQHLSVERQTVLELYIWEELSTHEIAEVLGWPVGTVKDRLRRAKLDLQMRLTPPAAAGTPPEPA